MAELKLLKPRRTRQPLNNVVPSNNNTRTTQNTNNGYTETYNNYVKNLEAQKVNANNEIAIAQQNTQKYLDNLMKSQGLYGSGIGQSAQVGVVNQANQLRNANMQEFNSQLNRYKNDYNANVQLQAANKIDSMISSGKSREEINDYIKIYQDDLALSQETRDYISNYANENSTSWEDNRKATLINLSNSINQLPEIDKTNLNKIARQIQSATTIEEYNAAVAELEKELDKQTLVQLGKEFGALDDDRIKNITKDYGFNNGQDLYSRIKNENQLNKLVKDLENKGYSVEEIEKIRKYILDKYWVGAENTLGVIVENIIK